MEPSARSSRLRCSAANFWLHLLFFTSRHAPGFARAVKPVFVWCAVRFSSHIRNATAANARRILGAETSDAKCVAFARRVTGHFYDFVADVGCALYRTPEQLVEQIYCIEGEDRYFAARASRRGAIIVTAHMGSFEVGLAALREMEQKVHVVFRRNDDDPFDTIRQSLRKRLGVIEAPVDEGFDLWMRLRDALVADEVVVIQGDRVMPGQKGQRVEFCGHHMSLATGPFKLAQATGAPIIPILTRRELDGRIHITIEPVVESITQLAAVLEKHVRAYPDQWLILQPAFCEDQPT